MGQQMSADDQDEGFKNVISRMLQEADEESEDSGKDEKKFLDKAEAESKHKVKLVGDKLHDEKGTDSNKSLFEQNKNSVGPTDDVYKKAHLEPNNVEVNSDSDQGAAKTDGPSKDTVQEQVKNIKVEVGQEEIDQVNPPKDDGSKGSDRETNSTHASGTSENNKTTSEPSGLSESESKDKSESADQQSKADKEKQRSLETVFLKDRIDNLITSCLSSKSSDLDIPVKSNHPPFITNQSSPFIVRNQHISRNNNSQESTNLSTYKNNSSNFSAVGSLQAKPALPDEEGRNNSQMIGGISSVSQSKENSVGNRETTTFQTLIEKVLDNSLQRNKSIDSSQGNSNGFKQNNTMDTMRQIPVTDHRMLNRNIHTIKNEIRNELLVKDAADKPKNDTKTEDMSINKSKVVYLKDHIEKVLEKSFQNSSRRDSDEAKMTENSLPEVARRDVSINRETEHRERTHSLVNETMPYRRDRSDNLNTRQHFEQGFHRERSNSLTKHPEYRRQASISSGETEVLGPPKLIKVTDMYPDMGREQGRYLQPPRIDTYDGNMRGCFKSSMSPGGSYTRSPHSQSPVSPYYNHSPNSWHGHSPREHSTVNMSPNHGVSSPNYQSSRYPHSPSMGHHVGRYPSASHPSQTSPNNRGFHPVYPQNSPHQPFSTSGSDARQLYPAGNMKASPIPQHHNQMYSKQHTAGPMMNSYQSNELVSPRHEPSSGPHYPQASPRQPYPAEMSPMMSNRSRMLYPSQAPPQHMSQGMLIPHSVEHSPNSMQRVHPSHGEHAASSHHARHVPTDHPAASLQHMRQPDHSSLHHARPTQMPTDQPPYPINNRVHTNVYPDKSNRVAQHGSQQISTAQYQKSPHYRVDRNTNVRNPPISSAMAPAPRPPANYYRQQQPHKMPQLYPSSPPIPSVREYNRNVPPSMSQISSHSDEKYVRTADVGGNARNITSHDIMKSPVTPVTAHEQALDFSVKRSSSSRPSNDPEMQPLDLTCKDKLKSIDTNRRSSVGKGYSGFEYLAEGPHDKGRLNRAMGRAEFQQNSQDVVRSRSMYPSPEESPRSVNYGRRSSEGAIDSSGFEPAQQSPHCQKFGYKPPPGPSITQGTGSAMMKVNEERAPAHQQVPLQQDPKKGPNISRHEPIQNILGSHSPSDILYLICRLCGQTYGSPYGFRKHFRNQHGFEPRAEHTIVQTISETKTALRSPPVQTTMAMNTSQTTMEVAANQNKIITEDISQMKSQNISLLHESAASSVNAQEKVVPNLPCENIEDRMKMDELTDLATGDRKYLECHECGQTFQLNDFGAYKRHCRQHGQPRIMNPFDTNYDLEQKNRSSDDRYKSLTEDSLHTCTVCTAQFSSADFLKDHVATSHSDTGQKQNPALQANEGDSALKDDDLSSLSVKKRIMEGFQKGQFENTQVDTSKKVVVMKSAADSMVTTASPDSSSDTLKISSAIVDSQSDPKTPIVNTPSDKQFDTDSKDNSDTGGCDSVKGSEPMETDTHYLHKKFAKRKHSGMTSSDIETKIVKKDPKDLGTRSPSIVSNNSCDSEQPGAVEGKIDPESEQESSSNLDSANESKEADEKCSTHKPEARHQLPFVWDRVTRSQVGRKQSRVADNP